MIARKVVTYPSSSQLPKRVDETFEEGTKATAMEWYRYGKDNGYNVELWDNSNQTMVDHFIQGH